MAVEAINKARKTTKTKKKATKVAKQLSYSWEGADKKGKKTSGEMTAENPAMVKAYLRKQGISPIKVTKKSAPLFGGGKGKPVETKDIALFSRQIAVMMKAGVPLVQSFEIIESDALFQQHGFVYQHTMAAMKRHRRDQNATGTVSQPAPPYQTNIDMLEISKHMILKTNTASTLFFC